MLQVLRKVKDSKGNQTSRPKPRTYVSWFSLSPSSWVNGPVAPNRVFKNKRLAGRMGGDRVTIQNLEVVKVDVERNVILIKGNIPGAKKIFNHNQISCES